MGFHGGGGFGRGGPGGRLDTDDINLKDVNLSQIPRLKEFVLPYIWRLLWAMCLVIAISLLGLVGPLLIGRAIDQNIPQKDYSGLGITALLYLGTMAAMALLRYSQTYVMSWTGQKILYSMRRRLFVHLQDLGLDFYDRLQAGRIMSRVTNDVESLNHLISSSILAVLSDLVTIGGIVIVMLRLNVRLALVTFITIPILFFVVFALRVRLTRAHHKVRRRLADITANLQESISGMKIVQAFSREDVNAEKFNDQNMQNLQANLEVARLHALFFPMVDVISALGAALIVYYGGLRISFGDETVTIGVLVVFLNYIKRFFWPIRNLTDIYQLLLAASVSCERVFEVLDTEPNVKDKESAIELKDVQGYVEFQDVVFGYDANIPILHGINLKAEPGESIALVGPTGAGKSSIISLLARFYDVQDGRILVDGIDIRDVTIRSLRKNMGIVLQDTFVFSGTIRDNIRYGRLSATDEEVEMAARLVGADEFIKSLPQGYDTEVRERGSRLSVGQRQLLAFARAILADPRILILDEATSSVDAYTEFLIQKALEKLLEGRTSIIIAHRLSTIKNAKRIYVIDEGIIREVGNHETLMREEGLYKTLYEKQFAGKPISA